MLKFKSTLQGIEESITRNILIQVAKDVRRLMGITKNVYTVYDEKDNFFRKKSKSGELILDNTLKEDIIRVSYEEEVVDDHDLVLTQNTPVAKFIYKDDEINAKLTPVYIPRKISIKFRYSHRSSSGVNAIMNKLRLWVCSEAYYGIHKLTYHYNIPTHINELINHIRLMKNEESLVDYINKTFDDRVDFVHPINGDVYKSDLAIRESQVNVVGYVKDNLYDMKPEFEEDWNVHTIEFNYEFTYDKPVALIMQYPLMVHNQLVPKKFREFVNANKLNKGNYIPGEGTIRKLTEIDQIFDIRNNSYHLNLSPYDCFTLPRPESMYRRVFCLMIQLDHTNTRLLCNVKDIPKIMIKDSVLSYMIKEGSNIGKHRESLFYFELFKDDTKDYHAKVIIDPNGELITDRDLDIKCVYRLVLNVAVDIDSLTPDAKRRYVEFVKGQLEQDNTRDSETFQECISYWKNVKYDKYNQSIQKDNLITDYLTLLHLHPDNISEAILGSNSFYDIPFRLSRTLNLNNNTVFTHHTLTSILKTKE